MKKETREKKMIKDTAAAAAAAIRITTATTIHKAVKG